MGKRRLLVKHEDSNRDDICNDFNFGFYNKRIFESSKSFLFLLEERKNGVLGILSGRVFLTYVLGSGVISIFSLCFLVVVNSKFTLEI